MQNFVGFAGSTAATQVEGITFLYQKENIFWKYMEIAYSYEISINWNNNNEKELNEGFDSSLELLTLVSTRINSAVDKCKTKHEQKGPV